MSEHERRWFDDDPLYNIWKNWQFYGSVAMALIAVGGFIATIRIMGSAVENGEAFQKAQISINTKLQTLIDTHENRIANLESWRDHSDRWNR